MMQVVVIILTKRKETICYCESLGYGGTMLSNIITNALTHVSVPVEEGSIIPIMGISHHPHHGHVTSSPSWAFYFIPIMDISLQCPTAKHNQPNNLINRIEGTHKSK
jgi:hypothetical protein